ncbi:acyltransferase [Cryptococcus bacillisporus CA1873]|uniref:Acyltransferase n=1 Tax=Cryptococcus bacillisporus CA1873 TaxID=1296111 RepID=A0ABR5B8Y6_CRYGA|nr:acyltransferase [Cryptococcus bacillisporus CA1873]|eukprot:KIR59988.1 acyltransferase [Cryptococcus gattii CA1873]
MAQKPLYTIPINDRPPHGPWTSKIFFPIIFTLAQLAINSAQFLFVPLLLVPFVGKRLFSRAIGWTKDGYGRLLIAITVLFGQTQFAITTDTPPPHGQSLVERDVNGQVVKINLPDRLVIMANHQAYLDWIYIWILACYAGHSPGLIILLKASLKNIPVVGWGMRFFNFIFLRRSWAADRNNLTLALRQLGKEAQSGQENSETSRVLPLRKRSPLWLLIFPEGTIVSDEERVKSIKYAKREGIDDFATLLHPRSTGLLFCLRTLLPQIPDLNLLDITIWYPGVPFGKYAQNWYGLFSVFLKSVPPPTVYLHLHVYSHLGEPECKIPSLVPTQSSRISGLSADWGLANAEEARAFELWLRNVWTAKEGRIEQFYESQRFADSQEIVPIQQMKWYHWISAVGGGGLGTVVLLAFCIWFAVCRR